MFTLYSFFCAASFLSLKANFFSNYIISYCFTYIEIAKKKQGPGFIMGEWNPKQKLFSEKLLEYLESYSDRCSDITYIVGPQKQVIKSSRIILEVGCPQFIKLFDEKWGNTATAVSKLKGSEDEAHLPDTDPEVQKAGDSADNLLNDSEIEACSENGIIPLPNTDPEAFQLFIKLLITDGDISDILKTTDVNLNTILATIDLCKEFEMISIHQQLESFAQENFFKNFDEFVKTDDFLKLSKAGLDTVLSLDDLCTDEVLVFDAVCKWAQARCDETNVEKTGGNIRAILGDTLFKIRFTVMPMTDFCKNVLIQDILTENEQLEILRYMGLSEEDKIQYDKNKILFSTTQRNGTPFLRFNILNDIPVVMDSGSGFVCDGAKQTNFFMVNRNVEMISFGFLGPIVTDGYYDVQIEIIKHSGTDLGTSFGKTENRVLAKKNKIFYVGFENPIILIATYSTNPNSGDWYCVEFSLKGPNTSCSNIDLCKLIQIENSGIGLYCEWYRNPMAEVRLKKSKCSTRGATI